MASVFLMRWLALCLATLAVTGCGHDLTRKDSSTLAPVSIAGRQLEYADPHGVNIYTFFTGGRYRYATLSRNRTYADSREGRYDYKLTGNNMGTIRFDKESAIRLVFAGQNAATGCVDGDQRVYRFTFE